MSEREQALRILADDLGVPPELVDCVDSAYQAARQEHERQHHRDVLDDQPADGDAATLRRDEAPLLECAQEYDGARDREGEAEDDAGFPGPAQPAAEQRAHQRRGADLRDGAGQRDRPHGEQLPEREVHADAEHEQDHADFGQLVRDRLVGDESWREGADGDAGDEVTDDRRHAQAARERAEEECEAEAPDDRGDERCGVIHRLRWGDLLRGHEM